MLETVELKILDKCRLIIAKAALLYPKLDLREVDIQFNLRGTDVAQAHRRYGKYSMLFNKGYFATGLDHILTDTIPHEVAHLVCFDEANNASHDSRWARACTMLGGTAAEKHDLPLIYASGKTYEYTTTKGFVVRVSSRIHKNIQSGKVYTYDGVEGKLTSLCNYIIV